MGDKLIRRSADHSNVNIVLSVEELDHRDTEADCQDYDDEEYKDCFDKATKADLTFLNCKLPWFTDHEDEICRLETQNIDKNIKEQFTKFITIYTNYMNGKYL